MSRKNRKSADRVKPAAGPACPSCAAPVPAAARFCPACGAALKEAPEAGKDVGQWAAWKVVAVGAVTGLLVVAVFGAVMYSQRPGAPSSASPFPSSLFDSPPLASSGTPPDLSKMTPREAADRLFDRVMMASEQGDSVEALRFAPMAIEAYGNLATLDRDAHYHLGLIHGVAGNRADVERQIAALRQGAPNHLLALVLEHDLAEQAGDGAAVARTLAAFAAAYDAERVLLRPEYDAHRNVIEKFRAATAAPGGASNTKPAGAP